MVRPRKVRFACSGTQAKRRVDSRLRQRQALRRPVETKRVKIIMDPCQLAIGLEKSRIMPQSLVQQIGCL